MKEENWCACERKLSWVGLGCISRMDMEQQKHYQWEDEEEEDAALQLQGRQSRPRNNNGNGHQEEDAEAEAEAEAEKAKSNYEEFNKAGYVAAATGFAEEEKEGKHQMGTSSGVEYFISEEINPADERSVEKAKKLLDIETSLTTEAISISHQNVEKLGDESLSTVQVVSCEEETKISFEHLHNTNELDVDVDLTEDIDLELTEYDVEKVIKKQNTHDLFCPNCKSCITRRVILLRRKPRISKPKIKSKGQLERDTATDISSNVTPTIPADRDPDVFRCLSCFSLFFSTASGFRLFPSASARDSTENRKPEPGGNISVAEKNYWFFPFFPSRSKETDRGGDRGVESVTGSKSDTKGINQAKQSYIHGKPLQGEGEGRVIVTVESPPDEPASLKTVIPVPVSETERTGDETSTRETPVSKTECTGDETSTREAPVTETERTGDETRTGEGGVIVVCEPGRTGGEARTREADEFDVLKSIVYGGLVESITSLGVVSSAAGGGATTLNIFAMGLANLIAGLFILGHNLRELKNEQYGENSSQSNERYQKLLGRRENFSLHATLAVISFLFFGLLPPVIYGFSFRQSDNRDLKLVVVLGASLICIILLAIAKCRVNKQPLKSYPKTILYYISTGVVASCVSYLVGELIKKLLEKLGWFDSSSTLAISLIETSKPIGSTWASF